MAEQDIKIERHVAIRGGCCKRDPWVVRNIDLVDGQEFIELSKRDPGFGRYVATDSSAIRQMTFLDHLRRLRTEKSMVIPDEQSLFGQMPTRAARQTLKRRCADLNSRGQMPEVIVLDLPPIASDERHVPGIRMRVKANLDINKNVYVELQPNVLSYIWHAMRASDTQEPKKRTKSSLDGVRWVSSRKVFMAQRHRLSDGKKEYRTFRPANPDDELDCDDAADRAKKWVAWEHHGDDLVDAAIDSNEV